MSSKRWSLKCSVVTSASFCIRKRMCYTAISKRIPSTGMAKKKSSILVVHSIFEEFAGLFDWILDIPLDHDSIYSGRVFGESKSSVRAHIEDKMITANIVLPDETYHIEVIETLFCLLPAKIKTQLDHFLAFVETFASSIRPSYGRL